MNKIEVMGRICKEVDVRFTENQKTYAFFEVAESIYNRKTKEQDSQFHKCVAWGKMAETIAEHFGKGDKIYIQGTIVYGSFIGKEGNKIATCRITVQNFEFCESKAAKEFRRAQQTTEKKAEKAVPKKDEEIPF